MEYQALKKLPHVFRNKRILSFLVRDTGPRNEADIVSVLTEADFAAGLPDPVITVPVGVEPVTNGAPFFEGLANVRVEAGQLLQIRYVPRDPEGELPGMY